MSADELTSTAATRRSDRRRAGRMPIPDVLRGVAILAMLIAHAGPFVPNMPKVLLYVQSDINDVASPLFALVMGISAQLVWNRRDGLARTWLQQTWRGILLFALGMWMSTWGSWVAIVLQALGALLIVGVPLLLLGTRMLIVAAVAILLISQPLIALARGALWIFTQPGFVIELANAVALGPSYRLINLLPFFLLGALLLRHGFTRDRMLWIMAAIAPLAYIASFAIDKLTDAEVKSGDYLDTLHDIGLVFAVYVAVVFAATARARGEWERVFVPFRACGQLALSLYVLHVGLIALWARANGFPQGNEPLGWLLIVPGMVLVAWVWWRFAGVGPVEWLMGLLTGRPKRLRPVR
ncbi:acyltransferase family protein [Microbacterium hydrocarbonoxydans]|uniref:acyltransferase family protein n=1 Tax=Microbacterium hydrocarbonoxydans TaxID=273678 RepID=UPI0013D9428D|nr:acyltransferase family protein [Microbacterium hydrocarbonoxydans]